MIPTKFEGIFEIIIFFDFDLTQNTEISKLLQNVLNFLGNILNIQK